MSSVSALKMPLVGALGVEPAQAHVLAAGEHGVGPVARLRVSGAMRHRVLAHGAEVDHQPEAGRVGRLAGRLEHPELEELVAGEVDARWG